VLRVQLSGVSYELSNSVKRKLCRLNERAAAQ
jgi:hypothetical protein